MPEKARAIARKIRRTLRVHERTHRGAIRIPDPEALLIAEVLEHFAATTQPIKHYDLYERPAVLWMDAARHLARVLTLTERQSMDLLEQATEELGIYPVWRPTQNGHRHGSYLTLTGGELRRIARLARKQRSDD